MKYLFIILELVKNADYKDNYDILCTHYVLTKLFYFLNISLEVLIIVNNNKILLYFFDMIEFK